MRKIEIHYYIIYGSDKATCTVRAITTLGLTLDFRHGERGFATHYRKAMRSKNTVHAAPKWF